MASVKVPDKVKLVIGVLLATPNLAVLLEEDLQERFGIADFKSKITPFSVTDYYNKTMGFDTKRQFFSFQKLIDPAILGKIKNWTNKLENKFAKKFATKQATRPANNDPWELNDA